MAIAKKGSRRITIDVVDYRWRANGDDVHYDQIAITVAPDGGPGMTLLFNTSGEHRNTLSGYSHPMVTPARVAEVIRLALRHGWRAGEPGKPFDLWQHLPAEWRGPMKTVALRNP